MDGMVKSLINILIFFQVLVLNGQMVSFDNLNSVLKKTMEALPASSMFEDRMQAFLNTHCTTDGLGHYNLTLCAAPDSAKIKQLIEVNQGIFATTFADKHKKHFYNNQEDSIKHWYFNATDNNDNDILRARISQDGKSAELLELKSSKSLSGTTLLKFWDDLCTWLRPATVYIWDDSIINSMNLRIIRPLINPDGLAWYAAYGYQPVTKKNQKPTSYQEAKDYLSTLPLGIALETVQDRLKDQVIIALDEIRATTQLSDMMSLGQLFTTLYSLDKNNPAIKKLFLAFIGHITRAGMDSRILLHDYKVANYPEFLKLRCALNILIKTIYFKKNYDVSIASDSNDINGLQDYSDYFQDPANLMLLVDQSCSRNTVKGFNQALRYMLAAPKQFRYERWLAVIKDQLSKNETKSMPDYLLIEKVLHYFDTQEPAKWCYEAELNNLMTGNITIAQNLVEFLIKWNVNTKDLVNAFAQGKLATIMLSALKDLIAANNSDAMYLLGKLLIVGPADLANNENGLALLNQSVALGNNDAAVLLAPLYTEQMENPEHYPHLSIRITKLLCNVIDNTHASESQRAKAYEAIADFIISIYDLGYKISEQKELCQKLLAYFDGKNTLNIKILFALGISGLCTDNIDIVWKKIKMVQETLMILTETDYVPLFKMLYELYWASDHCEKTNQEYYDFIFNSCYKELYLKQLDSQYAAYTIIDMFNNGHIDLASNKVKKAFKYYIQNIISLSYNYEDEIDRHYAQKLNVIFDTNNFESEIALNSQL